MDDSTTTYPESFWALVETRAAATPDHVVLADDLGRSLTAEELRQTAERVAAGLSVLGIGEGSAVSWQLPTCLEALVLSMALCRLGAVQNPIIAMLRERETAAILEQVRPDLVVTPPVWRDFDHQAMFRILLPAETAVVVVDHRAAAATGPGAYDLPTGDASGLPAARAPHADETRWVFSTSGTTGTPKGVRHTDASVIAGSDGMVDRLAMGPDDVYPIAFPIPHIGGPVMLAMALRSGCRLVLLDAFDPATSPELMADVGATLLGSALPFHLAYMAAQERHGPEPLYPRLKACTSGGAGKPPGHHQRVKAALGARAPCRRGASPSARWPPRPRSTTPTSSSSRPRGGPRLEPSYGWSTPTAECARPGRKASCG